MVDLIDSGSWAASYRPTKIRVTIYADGDIQGDNYFQIYIWDSSYGTLASSGNFNVNAGSTQKEMDLSFGANDINEFFITEYNQGSPVNYYITNIEFLN